MCAAAHPDAKNGSANKNPPLRVQAGDSVCKAAPAGPQTIS